MIIFKVFIIYGKFFDEIIFDNCCCLNMKLSSLGRIYVIFNWYNCIKVIIFNFICLCLFFNSVVCGGIF